MIALDPRAGEKCFDAPAMAGKTARPGTLVVLRPRQRIVPPFAGDRIRTRENMTADNDASAHAGAENDAEDDLRAGTGPVGRLRQREAVGVVRDRHFPPEQCLEIGFDRLAVETDRVGAAQQTGPARDRAGCADADSTPPTELGFRLAHESRDRRESLAVLSPGRRDAP